ncbi:MAG: hypothetical protein IT376_18995 [Polyangiaceae bacterium]|nr:hypothetical protein [Polyangiaceae bacterium]
MSAPSPEYVREFVESLPAAYRAAFDDDARRAHAATALARGGAPAKVGAFASPRPGAFALCVIAEDRPGLLATVGAAFVLATLDVVDGAAFTRATPAGRAEAVDLFWVHPSASATEAPASAAAAADRVERALVDLLEGRADVDTARPAPARAGAETIVRFIESEAGALATLEVETYDRSGLLLALARALFQQRVQIVGSQVKTLGDRVLDRFDIVELDHSPIGPTRRLEIQVAVIAAVQPR